LLSPHAEQQQLLTAVAKATASIAPHHGAVVTAAACFSLCSYQTWQ